MRIENNYGILTDPWLICRVGGSVCPKTTALMAEYTVKGVKTTVPVCCHSPVHLCSAILGGCPFASVLKHRKSARLSCTAGLFLQNGRRVPPTAVARLGGRVSGGDHNRRLWLLMDRAWRVHRKAF